MIGDQKDATRKKRLSLLVTTYLSTTLARGRQTFVYNPNNSFSQKLLTLSIGTE